MTDQHSSMTPQAPELNLGKLIIRSMKSKCASRQSANLDQSTNRTIASDLDVVMILLSRGVAHILFSTLALNLPTATVAFPAHLAPFSIVSSVTSRSPPLLSRPIFVHQLMLGAIAMTTSSSISGSAGESCKSYFDKSLVGSLLKNASPSLVVCD